MEFTGKTVEKAIENGLKELNKTREQVEIEILSEGGFFSKAKVLINIKEEKSENCECGCNDECSCNEEHCESECCEGNCECCGEDCNCDDEVYELETEDGNVLNAYMLGIYNIDGKEYSAFEALDTIDGVEEGDFLAFERVETEEGIHLEGIEDEIVDKVYEAFEKECKEIEGCSCGCEDEHCTCGEHCSCTEENNCGCDCHSHEDCNDCHEEKPVREYMSSEEVYEKIQEIFATIFKTLNLDAKVMILEDDDAYQVKVMGDDKVASLIGYRGEGLNAYQLLLNNFTELRNKSKKIYLDVENYRNKREESLKALAVRIARKVMKTKRRHKFEPMTAYERHIIHEELSNFSGVETHSEGVEPHRCLIVDIKKS